MFTCNCTQIIWFLYYTKVYRRHVTLNYTIIYLNISPLINSVVNNTCSYWTISKYGFIGVDGYRVCDLSTRRISLLASVDIELVSMATLSCLLTTHDEVVCSCITTFSLHPARQILHTQTIYYYTFPSHYINNSNNI